MPFDMETFQLLVDVGRGDMAERYFRAEPPPPEDVTLEQALAIVAAAAEAAEAAAVAAADLVAGIKFASAP